MFIKILKKRDLKIKWSGSVIVLLTGQKFDLRNSTTGVIPCQIIQGMTPLPLLLLVNFFTICRYCCNDQSLKISTLNSLRYWSCWHLKIWLKWVFQSKICYFVFLYVFCNNYCSSHPFILKFGMGKFFRGEKSKNHT